MGCVPTYVLRIENLKMQKYYEENLCLSIRARGKTERVRGEFRERIRVEFMDFIDFGVGFYYVFLCTFFQYIVKLIALLRPQT